MDSEWAGNLTTQAILIACLFYTTLLFDEGETYETTWGIFTVMLLFIATPIGFAQGGGGQRGADRGRGGGGAIAMLTIPAVQTELKMTAAQIAMIPDKRTEISMAQQTIMRTGGGFGRTPERQVQIRAATEKALAVLTDDQKSKWTAMKGAAFPAGTIR